MALFPLFTRNILALRAIYYENTYSGIGQTKYR